MSKFTGINEDEKTFKEIVYELSHMGVLANSSTLQGLLYVTIKQIETIKEKGCRCCYNEQCPEGCVLNKEEFMKLEVYIRKSYRESDIVNRKIRLALKQKTRFEMFRKIIFDRLFISLVSLLLGVLLVIDNYTGLLGIGWLPGVVLIIAGLAGIVDDVIFNNQRQKGSGKNNVIFTKK